VKKNNYFFFAMFIILLPLFIGCSSSKQTVDVLRNLEPNGQLSLCKYELSWGSNTLLTGALFGGAAAVLEEAKNQGDRPYYEVLCNDLNKIFEDSLGTYNTFKYSLSTNLVIQKDGEQKSVEEIIKDNNLFACVTAKSVLAYTGILGKKLELFTTWEITGLPGWKLELETDAVSLTTYGFQPNRGNPEYKPVWLELAKESAQQFKQKFTEMLNESRKTN
jgi:hypothetical protein